MENFFQGDHAQLESVRVRILPDGRMTREHAAAYLGVKPKTLAMWAVEGKGPKSVRVGGRVFYYWRDLDAFIQGRDGADTADSGLEAASP